VEADLTVLETLYWWGIPPLFRCPADSDPAHCDVALRPLAEAIGNPTQVE
jgi:guanidinopropionase